MVGWLIDWCFGWLVVVGGFGGLNQLMADYNWFQGGSSVVEHRDG